MRRRRNKSEDVGVTLFPFLAVLLCTMGTLIVLLLVITDRARNSTDEPPSTAEADLPKVANAEDDPGTWRARAEQLSDTREEVSAIVKDRRARLGFLEQTTRELENKIVEVKARLAEQQRLSQGGAEQTAKTEAEVKRLEDRAVRAAANLEEIRRENTNRPASFSIVPYDGPNSTPRRPVYIECRGKEVLLQPEGIILSADDFLIASDAGNPLATVLRATREYLVTSRSLKAEEEPYPLIIVRPDGVEAYYAVRQSLQGWTTEFGYELVNQDWTLTFPPADPNLATAQYRALAEARLRQRALANMLQRKTKKNPSYLPGARAGIVREGDDHGFGAAGIPYHGEEADDAGGDGSDGDGAGGANAGDLAESDLATGRGGSGAVGSDRPGDGISSNRQDAGDNGTGRSVAGNTPGGPGGGAASHSARADGTANGTGGASADAQPNASGANGPPIAGSYGDRSYGDPRDPESASTARAPRAGEFGARKPNPSNRNNRGAQATPDGGAGAGGETPEYGSGGAAGGGLSGGQGGDSGGSSFSSGAPDTSIRKDSAKHDSESLANRRGRDWGLRYAAPTATPVTRPLRVVCYSDRIIVLTEDAKRDPKQIVLKPQTKDSADEFVAALWDEIKAWGIAGKGMYWRPILSFDVHAGGDQRYEDFARLLDGSGFEVRRRATAVAQQGHTGTPARPQR